MQVTNRTPKIVVALCIVLAAAALIGATVWTPAKNTPVTSPVAKGETIAPMVGTFTGEFENGAPVYRLPVHRHHHEPKRRTRKDGAGRAARTEVTAAMR